MKPPKLLVPRPVISSLLAALVAVVSAAPGVADVLAIRIDTIIHPVAAEFLRESLAEADAVGADAIIVELSTPGGLLGETRDMSTAMLNARTPVIGYVAPSGAQAASAGFFLLMSADIAVMAPGTNTGAAHPVGGQGEEIEGSMGDKVEQDAAANIRALATRYSRNVELAEAAVVESRSYTAEEALEGGLVELIAPSLENLLEQLDGREITKGERTIVLATKGKTVRHLEMSPVQSFLSHLVHPNIAYILMSLGFLGLYFEFQNPGAILPGVVGAFSFILAFYALSVLPLNYAGVALLLLAALLFVAEVKVTSYGLLTVAGVVALVLGSLMLFKSPDSAIRVSVSLIAAVAVAALLVVGFLATLVFRAHRNQVQTGREGLVGERGVARTALAPAGKVSVHGEIWHALADASSVAVGETVEIVSVDGMRLRVRRGDTEVNDLEGV